MFPKMGPKMYGLKDPLGADFGTPDGYKFFLEIGPLASAKDARAGKEAGAFLQGPNGPPPITTTFVRPATCDRTSRTSSRPS